MLAILRSSVLGVLLVLAGCGIQGTTVTVFGMSFEDDGQRVTLNGVELPHARWETVTLAPAADAAWEIATGTGPISLTASDSATATLDVEILSELEGDGEVVVEGGRLVSRSADGYASMINAVRGTLPRSLGLTVRSGTGPIALGGFRSDHSLRAETGTSAIEVRDGESARAHITSGVGSIDMSAWVAADLQIETGTSSITLTDVRTEQTSAVTGTGDVFITSSHLGAARIETGTGDAHLVDSHCAGRLDFTSGIGDLSLEGGAIGHLSTDLGLGSVSQRGTVITSQDD